MAGARRTVVFPAIFDESILSIDQERLPAAAAEALRSLRTQTERHGGIPQERLKRCHGDARDGTDLAGCVKTYLPWPDGPWGVVFRAGEEPDRPFALYTIAFSVRHPEPGRTSVYRLAHRRLHG